MAGGSSTTVALTREWADRVQEQWDENGRRFGDEELTLMREAAGSIHAHGLGVPAISTPDYWQRATRDLAAVLDSNTEAGWELVIGLLIGSWVESRGVAKLRRSAGKRAVDVMLVMASQESIKWDTPMSLAERACPSCAL